MRAYEDSFNLASGVAEVARRFPSRAAILCPRSSITASNRLDHEQITYAELHRQALACAAGWAKRGVSKGERVLIMARPSIDFMVAIFGLMHIGATPVFIDGGIAPPRMMQLIEEARAKAMLAGPEALAFRTFGPLASIGLTVAADCNAEGVDSVRSMVEEAGEGPCERLLPSDLVAIAFTSGSTGLPKGVECTARMAVAGTCTLAHDGLGPEDNFLAILPTHLFGALALGVTCVLPAIDVTRPGAADPAVLISQIEQQAITYTVGPPAVWAKIADHCEAEGVILGSLRRVSISGAPVHPALIRRLSRAIPNGEIHTPLGATEGAPIADIGAREILGETASRTEQGGGVCVGRVIPEHELKVIEIHEGAFESWDQVRELARGDIGELIMRGPVVSERYFQRDADTKKSKLRDPSGRIWHRLGDCGYEDQQGRFWYCGRIAHIVVKDGKRYFPVNVEGASNVVPGVARTALVSTPQGELAVVVELRSPAGAADRSRIVEEVYRRARSTGCPVDHVLLHPDVLPTDPRHNSKIERLELASWASEQLRGDHARAL